MRIGFAIFLEGSIVRKGNSVTAKEVGQRAVQYAVENYPEVLTYGVVKYLDQWVCENGYFADEKGGEDAFYRRSEAGEDANPADRKAYYNCHTAYGILLEGDADLHHLWGLGLQLGYRRLVK